jgi:hypothetical protein
MSGTTLLHMIHRRRGWSHDVDRQVLLATRDVENILTSRRTKEKRFMVGKASASPQLRGDR